MIRPEKLKRTNDTFFAKLLNINPIAAKINFSAVQFFRRIFLMSVLNFAEFAV